MKGESMSDLLCSECNPLNSASKKHVAEIYHHIAMAGTPLAMGYVPTQSWETPFSPCKDCLWEQSFPVCAIRSAGKGKMPMIEIPVKI